MDELNKRFMEAVHTAGSQFFKTRRTSRTQKLSDYTLYLMVERRSLRLQSPNDSELLSNIGCLIYEFGNPCDAIFVSLILLVLRMR